MPDAQSEPVGTRHAASNPDCYLEKIGSDLWAAYLSGRLVGVFTDTDIDRSQKGGQ